MHDIVKAVGNCSYNQLVEKIISCKQSDNSERAGEGGRALSSLLLLSSDLSGSCLCFCSVTYPALQRNSSVQLNIESEAHSLHHVCLLGRPVPSSNPTEDTLITWPTSTAHTFSENLSETSQVNICSFNTEFPERSSAGLLPSQHINILVDGDIDVEDSLLFYSASPCAAQGNPFSTSCEWFAAGATGHCLNWWMWLSKKTQRKPIGSCSASQKSLICLSAYTGFPTVTVSNSSSRDSHYSNRQQTLKLFFHYMLTE